VVDLEINLAEYDQTGGSSYIPLPKQLNGKKAIIKMKNEDNQCFKVSSTLKHPPRVDRR